MYPLLRLIRVVVKSYFQEKLSFDTEYTDSVNLIVLPQDIDPFMELNNGCLLYTSPSPRDRSISRMPSSA